MLALIAAQPFVPVPRPKNARAAPAPKPSASEPSAMPALEPARVRKLRRAGSVPPAIARRTHQAEIPATAASGASVQKGPATAKCAFGASAWIHSPSGKPLGSRSIGAS